MSLLVVASAVYAPPALAGSATSEVRFTNPGGHPYQQIHFVAGAGEANRLAATLTPTALELTDPVGITPLGGCVRPLPSDLTAVACLGSSLRQTSFKATLGDRDDAFSADRFVVAHGGSGADVLRADGFLFGDSGDDRLFGQGAADTLNGGPARDMLSGGADGDRLAGESGDDTVLGDSGADLLRGGAGRDVLDGGQGFDELYGDGGRDRLRARDGHTDDVHCAEADAAQLDRVDMLSGRCGQTIRAGAPRAVPVGDLDSLPLAFALTSFPSDALGTGVGCPADRTRSCTGSLLIRDEGVVLGSKDFRLLPGRKRQLSVHVGRGAVHRARSGDAEVTLVVTTRDRGRTLRVVATAPVF